MSRVTIIDPFALKREYENVAAELTVSQRRRIENGTPTAMLGRDPVETKALEAWDKYQQAIAA